MKVSGQDISFMVTMESKSLGSQYKMEIAIQGDKTAMKPLIETGSDQQMHFMFDYGKMEQTTFIESNGQKYAMVGKLPITDAMMTEEEIDKKIKITHTDETKTISGYKCKKTILSSKDMTSEVWTTDEIEFGSDDIFRTLQSYNGSKGKRNDFVDKHAGVSGFPILIEAEGKKASESMTMTISDIREGAVNEALFSTNGYQVIDQNSMMK
jgi:hypothetical protein